MTRSDIVIGLKNAVERGYSLEQAKQTMINSGYNLNDINEAVSYLTGGLAGPIEAFAPFNPSDNPITQTSFSQQVSQEGSNTGNTEKPKKKSLGLIISLSALLLILLIVLILVMVYREKVTDFLAKLFV